ncbi:hypothetical protein J3A83DRAFT_1434616 [Scleroderma citrinum]
MDLVPTLLMPCDCNRSRLDADIELPASMTVTADTLATCCGLIGDPPLKTPKDDHQRILQFRKEIAFLLKGPRESETIVYYEFAAKYLLATVAAYKQERTADNLPASILSRISDVPYFIRYVQSPAGSDLVTSHAERTVAAATFAVQDKINEICHFLFELLMIRGPSAIRDDIKQELETTLKTWMAIYIGHHTASLSYRCLTVLRGEFMVIEETKARIEKPLMECGAPDCDRRVGCGNPELQQCSRCKSAVYCSKDHQVQDWKEHKKYCFKPAY